MISNRLEILYDKLFVILKKNPKRPHTKESNRMLHSTLLF